MDDAFERDVHCLLGLPFDVIDIARAASRLRDAASSRRQCVMSTPNLNFLMASQTSNEFRDSVIQSDLSIADGMPIVWLARFLGIPLRTRVAGADVFEYLRASDGDPISVYFFGGAGGVAETACNRLNGTARGLVCVGSRYPGHGSVEQMSSDETIARINASGAQFVVVALGAGKGQAWIMRNRDRITAPIICHLGAVINFVAGTVKRAPMWTRRLGLEWLWRIKEEPSLWRRYVADGLLLVRLLATRILPYWWATVLRRPSAAALAKAQAKVLEREMETIVLLSGPWVAENLKAVRKCFTRAARSDKNIRLDMQDVNYVDDAFIGLTLLLYGERKRRGSGLSIVGPTKRVRKIFHYAGTGFLLGGDCQQARA